MDLRGVGIQVWHPWYGAEASLIDSQVAEFNQENDWGITVRTRGHTSFTELYNAVTEALPGNEGPQLAIALPEHALAWDAEGYVVDLTAYVADPTAGLSKDELSDFPKAFRNQDLVEGTAAGNACTALGALAHLQPDLGAGARFCRASHVPHRSSASRPARHTPSSTGTMMRPTMPEADGLCALMR